MEDHEDPLDTPTMPHNASSDALSAADPEVSDADPGLDVPIPRRPLRTMSSEERFRYFRRTVIDALLSEHCYQMLWSSRFGIGDSEAKRAITSINRMRAELVAAGWSVDVVDRRVHDTNERIIGICVSIPALTNVVSYILRDHYPMN
jgi:hypothetical protein